MSPKKAIIHGWINLYKPVGLTSAKAVSIVRNQLNCAKIGHGGTLDPLASGVLPIAIGEATKTVSYVMDSVKKYEFTLCWGYETTTDDKEGFPTRVSEKYPTDVEILSCIPKFVGKIEQKPPYYSAVKINGKRAYKLARCSEKQGLTNRIELKPREVVIQNLSLLSQSENEARFAVTCKKGTYIRSLGRDMGRFLDSAAHVSNLKRVSVGNFDIKNTISLDFLKSLRDIAQVKKNVLSLLTVLDDIPALFVTPEEATRIKMGQRIAYYRESPKENKIGIAICGGEAVALIKVVSSIIHPIRVFNL